MKELMATPEHIVIGGVGVVQDAALCLWILTHENPWLGKRLFFDCMMHIDFQEIPKVYDGRHLVQLMLPADLNIDGIVQDGRVIAGINKKVAKKNIVKFLYQRSRKAAMAFLNSLQRIAAEYFARRGFSVGLSCLEPDKIDSIQSEVDMSIQGDDWEILRRGIQYKEQKAHKAKAILSERNRFLTLTSERSCAKGSLLNIIQMLSSLGQQFFKGGLIKTYRKSEKGNRVLSSDKFGTRTMQQHGYVESGFLKGLNPQELFLHAISARLSLLDTALKTATSGYASRRLWKSMEDCLVQYDQTLRCNSRMLMFKVPAELEAGRPVGLEAAQKIGQMIMQLTLNTFHLAGTNNNTVTSGVPRLESLINVWSKKQAQQQLVYHEGVSAWDAHNIILKEDTLLVKDLMPDATVINYKTKTPGRSQTSLRFKFMKKTCMRYRVSMWHIEQAIAKSKLGAYCFGLSKGYSLSIVVQTPNQDLPKSILMSLKDEIMNLSIRGKGQKIFYDSGKLERKGCSLRKAFEHGDWTKMHSTSIIETMQVLGISAAKDQLIIELNKVFNNGVDPFDIQCLAEWMCNKGTLTSTTRSGIASFYDEENILKSMAFERTLRTASKAAKQETVASFKGLSEKILVNKLIKTGSGFCDIVHDNDAYVVLEDAMLKKRELELERKRQREAEEEPWLYDPCDVPPEPAYSPFHPVMSH